MIALVGSETPLNAVPRLWIVVFQLVSVTSTTFAPSLSSWLVLAENAAGNSGIFLVISMATFLTITFFLLSVKLKYIL